jgi:hypothetical protein
MSNEDERLIWEARISRIHPDKMGLSDSDGVSTEDEDENHESDRPETGDERWERLHRDHPDVVAGYRKGLGPGYKDMRDRAQAEYDKKKHATKDEQVAFTSAGDDYFTDDEKEALSNRARSPSRDEGEEEQEEPRLSPKDKVLQAIAKLGSNYDEFGLGTFEEDDDPWGETEGEKQTREDFSPVNSLKRIQEILPKFMQQHYTGEQFDSVQRVLYNVVAELNDIIEYNEYESQNPGYGKDER